MARLGDADVRFNAAKARRIMASDGEKYQRLKAQSLLFLAQAIAPVKTGRLRASHELRRKRRSGADAFAIVATAPYAAYVHAGQHPYQPMRAQPWLREATRRLQ